MTALCGPFLMRLVEKHGLRGAAQGCFGRPARPRRSGPVRPVPQSH